MKVLSTLSVCCLSIALVGCSSSDSDQAEKETHEKDHVDEHAHHEAHWGYEGAGSADHWGDLKEEFALCKMGKVQSPIDIKTASLADEELPSINVSYSATPLTVVNNGHAIQVNYAAGSSITVGGKSYDLLQFHFHNPSEHTIDGKAFDMVAHLVHKAEDGQLGVIGVLFDAGAENAMIAQVFDNLPAKGGEEKVVEGQSINVADILPSDLSYYNYPGSLTTPPCSEGVHWMVLTTPVQASSDQIAKLATVIKGNVRPVQPVNERVIKK